MLVPEGDLLIRLADTRPAIVGQVITSAPGRPSALDRILTIGWNPRAAKIITLLDCLVEPGSPIDIAAPLRPKEDLQEQLENLAVGHKP
ncbi:hypothetical protein MOV08_32905 [Streptomyces yunnanensis]|uniref:Uncharacterized protein n=1 Tax=Streptomyces yunnanensis TaxID=156453 RepID=A0ABY8AG24_9ACTN|nr:hypothetical protein [Streptomyces yunnanensis]WEB43606.1 hypothetical protein MOV08_32905 [Streptomyces yunnanensis]